MHHYGWRNRKPILACQPNKPPQTVFRFFRTGHTLLQLTYDRFRKIIPPENIFIVTNEQYEGLVKQQIPDADDKHILLEPQRRNTAPCIAWAAYRIQSIDPEANIVVTPSDRLLILKEDAFAECIDKGLEFVEKFPALLTLGVKPSQSAKPDTDIYRLRR